MKSRGGLGREVPLLLPRFYFFALPFTLHRSPLSERPLSERLEQAKRKANLKIFEFKNLMERNQTLFTIRQIAYKIFGKIIILKSM